MSDRNGAEEEEGEPCNMCEEVPESIIYLNCEHKMCLMCTARSVFEAGKAVGDEVTCPLCGQSTAISAELQEALEELLTADASEHSSAAETSVMAAGSADASVHREAESPPPAAMRDHPALACPLHLDEEFVYYHAKDRRLLCAQCALRENDAGMEELRPLRRCLPQAVEAFGLPFAEAELELKRLEVSRAELDFQRQAFTAVAEAEHRRMAAALDEVTELIADFKASSQHEFFSRLDVGLEHFKTAEAQLRVQEDFLRTMCRKFGDLRAKKNAEAKALAFVLENGDALQRRLHEEEGGSQHPYIGLAAAEMESTKAWTLERGRHIREVIEARLRRAFGRSPPDAPYEEKDAGPQEWASAQSQFVARQQKTAFSFRPKANVLLARLQQRARGEESRPSPCAAPLATSTTTLTARRGSAAKPWMADSQLRPHALAYSALQRRRIETKLRVAGHSPLL